MDSPPHTQDALYKDASTQHAAALVRLARSYEADPDKRRDLLQEIHLALWRSFAGFDGRCSMRTWVYRIAHNVATTHIIKSKRLTGKTARLEDIENMAGPDPATQDPLAHAGHQQDLERLMVLIGRLNILDHAIIVLYLEGEDAASIAEVTGLTASNVATKVHRIKTILAQKFRDGGSS
ncbi:MAG: sigma-70 family RNA polymerase sigma factor [Rhodospirillaceae bacterium]|nr:sigma-70 family RNA polymerase sigma factor [Rhodospirillaceae bacterium]